MRTRILILLMAISFTVNAQGDLQFNQVLTFTGTTGSTIIYTVPVGKVAKITKAKGNVNGSSDSYDIRFTYNGVNYNTSIIVMEDSTNTLLMVRG